LVGNVKGIRKTLEKRRILDSLFTGCRPIVKGNEAGHLRPCTLQVCPTILVSRGGKQSGCSHPGANARKGHGGPIDHQLAISLASWEFLALQCAAGLRSFEQVQLIKPSSASFLLIPFCSARDDCGGGVVRAVQNPIF
jgi:hypothetical protein